MKFIWIQIGLLVIILLFQNMLTIANALPLSENYQENREMTNKQYKNVWYLQRNYSSDVYKRYSLVFQNKELGNDVSLKSTTNLLNVPMDSLWPMQSHDVFHMGRSSFNAANNPGTEIWQIHGVSAGGIEQSSAVIDNNGIIYFGTLASDDSLYAMYPNGTEKWRYKAEPSTEIWSTPAVAEDGTIYVATWGGGYLNALNPDGTQKWAICLIPYTNIDSSISIGNDGTIYFGCENGRVYAFNPNGTEKWNYSTGGDVASCPAIGNNNIIYVGSGDGYLYALCLNGTLSWRFKTGGWIKGNPTISDNGTIYAPSFDGYLYALSPNGTMQWRATTGPSIAAAGIALASDGTIYVGTEILRAYYPNGTLKWENDYHAEMWGTVPAISADGTIFISGGGYLVAINPDGTERWRCPIAGEHDYSSPCIGSDGTVYVGTTWSDYGYLHAIGSGEPKKIKIQSPKPGEIYLFGRLIRHMPENNTFIIGSALVKVQVYSENDIDSIHFWVGGADRGNLTKPPFEWKMNHRYGKWPLMRETITVVALYKGGCSWTDSIPVWYFHLL